MKLKNIDDWEDDLVEEQFQQRLSRINRRANYREEGEDRRIRKFKPVKKPSKFHEYDAGENL